MPATRSSAAVFGLLGHRRRPSPSCSASSRSCSGVVSSSRPRDGVVGILRVLGLLAQRAARGRRLGGRAGLARRDRRGRRARRRRGVRRARRDRSAVVRGRGAVRPAPGCGWHRSGRGPPGRSASPSRPRSVPRRSPRRRSPAASLRMGIGMTAQISCTDLVRIFSSEGVEVQALQGLNLEIEAGELTAIVGASGSGKSTLLTILSGLDAPTAGSATVDGHDLLAMRARERTQYRRETVGFVFQQTERNLVPFLTVAENITMALSVAGTPEIARARSGVDGPARVPAASPTSRTARPPAAAVGRSAPARGDRRRPRERAAGAAGRRADRRARRAVTRPRSSRCCATSTRTSASRC